MKIDVTFRGMDHTEAIENYISKNIIKFKKFFGNEDKDSIFVHVILEGQCNHNQYMVEIRIKSPHFNLVSKRTGVEMYPLIDNVMHIMEGELKKSKEKRIDSIHEKEKISEIDIDQSFNDIDDDSEKN